VAVPPVYGPLVGYNDIRARWGLFRSNQPNSLPVISQLSVHSSLSGSTSDLFSASTTVPKLPWPSTLEKRRQASRSAGSRCHRASGDVSVSCPVHTRRFRLDVRKTAAGDGTGHRGAEISCVSAVEHTFLFEYETSCRSRQGKGALNADCKWSQVA
jgi:hypothetical protein